MGDVDGRTVNEATRGLTTAQIASVMLIIVLSTQVVLLQPLLLGPLAAEGKLTLPEVGRTAMLEAIGTAIAIVLCGVLLEPRRLRSIILAAVTTSIVANVTSVVVSHEMLLATRFVSGVSIGVLLWVWTGLLTRAALPSRLVAIMLVLQASGALVLSYLFPRYLVPLVGGAAGYACLAAVTAIAGLLTIWAPSEYAALANHDNKGPRLPRGRGLVALLAVFLHMAAIMAFWVFVVPLGKQMGLSESFVNLTASVALGSQIAGALCAAIFCRLPAKPALLACLAASVAGLFVVSMGAPPAIFLAGCTLIVFLWMFAPAYQMPYLLEVDPSGRAGMQLISAQLAGMSAGPALVSLVVRDDFVTPSLWVSGGLYVAAALSILVTAALRTERTSTVGSQSSGACATE